MSIAESNPAPFVGYEVREISGTDGKYTISTDGEVFNIYSVIDGRRIYRKNPRPLRAWPNKEGQIAVGLRIDGTYHARSIALLMMETFGPPKEDPTHEVKFNDGNSLNVKLSNLRWGKRGYRPRLTRRKYLNRFPNHPS